jgi:rare lipoprotein A
MGGGRMVLAAAVLTALVLVGCAGGGQDRPPSSAQSGDDDPGIPDAVPRVEPRSRYGNPPSYVVFGKRYYTKDSSDGHVERGLASWYGKKFHGRKTSSGERYDMYGMTAAHKTLPLPSYVRVTNLENGRSAVVKVNDRGPFHGTRVIDLSYSAAKKIGVIANGTAMVEVRSIDPSRPGSDPGPRIAARSAESTPAKSSSAVAARGRGLDQGRAFRAALAASGASEVSQLLTDPVYLQVGAFGDAGNAERLRQRLVGQVAERVWVQPSAASGPTLFKVRVGPMRSEAQLRKVSRQLEDLGVLSPRRVVGH